MQKNKKRTKSKKAALNKSLNFTPADLQANQQGFITFQQKRRLRRLRLPQPDLTVIVWGIFLFSFFISPTSTIFSAFYFSEMPLTGLLCVSPILAVLMLYLYSTWILVKDNWQTVTKDIVGNCITHVTGSAEIREGILHIGAEEFLVGQDVKKKFVEHRYYDVYYTPQSKIILSVEEIQPKDEINPEGYLTGNYLTHIAEELEREKYDYEEQIYPNKKHLEAINRETRFKNQQAETMMVLKRRKRHDQK